MLYIDSGTAERPIPMVGGSRAWTDSKWSSAIVVPLRAENGERVLRLISSLRAALEFQKPEFPTLLVLVLNSLKSKLEAEALLNQELRQTLSGLKDLNFDIVLLDHAHEGRSFNEKSGVGLARKIGCDFAADLIKSGQVRDSWIRCTDADAQVSHNYLSEIPVKSGALIYPFRHSFDAQNPAQARAALLYDAYLRYLRLGMVAARSTFAYHSIGSLIAVHADSYRVARGFPDYQAGEDFYFLNKIRKLAPVQWCGDVDPVILEGRISNRVPFGTGRSIIKILSEGENSWSFYHPESFRILGQALEALQESRGVFSREKSPEFYDFCQSRKMIEKFANIARQCKSPAQWQSRCLELFDGFEQMKFLHYLRDHGHPALNWGQAASESWFLESKIRQFSGDLAGWQQSLVALDESTPFV